MRRMTNEKTKPEGGHSRIRNLSLFWKHLLMMIGILILCLIALLLIHRISLSTLTEEHLEKTQSSLTRNCEQLSESMYATRSIPVVMSRVETYKYLRSELSGQLPRNKYGALYSFMGSMTEELYLQSGCSECILYHIGSNSLITQYRCVPVAEDYFKNHLQFDGVSPELMLSYLRDRGNARLIPMQMVKLGRLEKPQRAMALIMYPTNVGMSVMTVYTEEYILDALGITGLSENMHMEIRAASGELLMQYPNEATEEERLGSHELTARLEAFDADVTVWVPHTYYSAMLQPVRQAGIAAISLVAIIGLLLSLYFSRVSVIPIRKLIRIHAEDDRNQSTNEITLLDQLINNAKQKTDQVQKLLSKQVLARALSGTVLSERDEAQLSSDCQLLSGHYRVAILHATEDINEVLGEYLSDSLEDAEWALLNRKETGFIIPGDEEPVARLTEAVNRLLEGLQEGVLLCGISAPASDLTSLHKAVRQARTALPKENGVRRFPGEQIRNHAISWLQHERLYQCIFANNEEDAHRLLNAIAAQTDHGNGREVYYNVRFVLRSAAEEMDVPLSQHDQTDYTPGLLPHENIQKLQILLTELFARIREKNEGRIQDEQMIVLDYIRSNLGNFDLCASSTAAALGISESRVYRVIRRQTDKSFSEYLSTLRAEKAAAMLCSTQLSLSEISTQCGYRVTSTFYRQFKERFGVSPGQYRTGGQDAGKAEI